MHPKLLIVAGIALASLWRHSYAEIPSRAVLFRHADVLDVTISPDGRRIAFLALDGDRTNIWVAPVEQPDEARPLIREPGRSVFAYAWAGGSERLVYQTGQHPRYWTENRGDDDYVIYSLNTKNGVSRPLTPKLDRRVKFRSSTRRPDELFVSPSPRMPQPQALRIDLLTGSHHRLAAGPGLAPVYADDDLEPRLASHWAPGGGIEVFVRPGREDWRSLRRFSFAERLMFELHGFARKGAYAVLTHAADHDTGGLYAIDLATGAQTVIAHADGAVIGDVLLHPRTGAPIAYRSGRFRQAWAVLDRAYATDFERLKTHAATLAGRGADALVISRSARDSLWVVAYEADVMPRRYYLYDRRSGKLRLLFAESKARALDGYSPMHPVAIAARDGLELTGYLTLPLSADALGDGQPSRPLPMVLWIHGGPHSQETWRFDGQAQWLASRGYAVLSLNFRGSTGFGKRFIEAAYGEWGGRMQDDLVDAVRWAIGGRIADPRRIAVMGLSYGGYAALSVLAGEPELFACGAETVGLSDLNLFLDTLAAHRETISDAGLRAELDARMSRERMQLGGDERTTEGRARLASRSPLTHAEKIRVPVLIVHGLLDNGVVPAHSERMAAALKRHGAPVTYLTYSNEGHGLARPDNRVSHAAIVEAFLANCLGGVAAPMERAEFAGSTLAVRQGAENVPGLPAVLNWLQSAE